MNAWIERISERVRMNPLELLIPKLDTSMLTVVAAICAVALVAIGFVALSLGFVHTHELCSSRSG